MARNPNGGLHSSSREGVALITSIAETPLLGEQREYTLAMELRRLRSEIVRIHQCIVAADEAQSEIYHRQLDKAESALTKTRDEFFYANIKLVIHVASEMSRMEFDDMFMMGCEGLMRAIDLYDPERGRFSTYANTWIRQAIQRGCDKESSLIVLPVHIWDLIKKLRKASIQYTQKHSALPTIPELCIMVDTKLSKDRIRAILIIAEVPVSLDTRNNFHVTHLEDYIGEIGFQNFNLELTSEETVVDTVLESDRQNILKNAVRMAIQALETHTMDGDTPFSTHAQVLRLRYRIGEQPPKNPKRYYRTLQEIGVILGIRRDKVGAIESEAVAWIVEHLPDLRDLWTSI